MTKVLENSLPIAITAMTLILIPLIAIGGITSSVTFLAIIYVAMTSFYTGYKIRAKVRAKS